MIVSIKANYEEVKQAELFLANAMAPQIQASGGLEVSDQGSQCKTQQNLAFIHLDQGVSHLEVAKFVKSMRTFITAGFRGVIPTTGVWIYVAPFLSSSWLASMKSRGVQDQSLKQILQALKDESSLLCPVHKQRIEFLKERRNNSSHSDFLQRLEFDSLTKESLMSHLFLEESDHEIQSIRTKLLAKNPKGNLDELRTIVKTHETSNWYKPGNKGRANRAGKERNGGGAGAGGGRWCSNCRS